MIFLIRSSSVHEILFQTLMTKWTWLHAHITERISAWIGWQHCPKVKNVKTYDKKCVITHYVVKLNILPILAIVVCPSEWPSQWRRGSLLPLRIALRHNMRINFLNTKFICSCDPLTNFNDQMDMIAWPHYREHQHMHRVAALSYILNCTVKCVLRDIVWIASNKYIASFSPNSISTRVSKPMNVSLYPAIKVCP